MGREIQIFLAGYIVISLCEIFTIGGITSLDTNVALVCQDTFRPTQVRG